MLDDSGIIQTTERGIGKCITDFYNYLFKSREPNWHSIEQALQFVDNRVDDAMNNLLNTEFSDKEIKQAAFDINPSKAPGPDG